MAQNNGAIQHTPEMAMIEGLLTGKLLSEIKKEIVRLEQNRDTVKAHLERFTGTDRQIVRETVRELLATGQFKELPLLNTIVNEEMPQHTNMPLVLAALQARIPVWLYGDSGSGKTTTASLAAKVFGLNFRLISVCPTTTKSEFFGYCDAVGKYHATAFREIYEHGGVFLIDEIDNGNPSILAALNTSLANDYCAFPDSNIKRHENAVIIAAANTIGRGADIRYIGRNALDATTLDRFVFIRHDIDETLETALTGTPWTRSKLVNIADGGQTTVAAWLKTVRNVRKACQELGIDHLISPRATIYGQRLIAAGVGSIHLENMCLWKGLRDTDRNKIIEHVKKMR